MSTDPTLPTYSNYEEITAQQWYAAAARAAVRDLTLLEEAFAGIDLTDDVRRLFAAVIRDLGRDHLLTLTRLPALLATAANTSATSPAAAEGGPVEAPDAAQATTATVEAHQRALNHAVAAWRTPGSDHPADAILRHARQLLDIAAALAGRTVPVVSRLGPPVTIQATPPDAWTLARVCRAGQLRRRQLLLGYTDLHGVAVLPEPETIHTVIAGSTVTVRTHTGRVLILTGATTTYFAPPSTAS